MKAERFHGFSMIVQWFSLFFHGFFMIFPGFSRIFHEVSMIFHDCSMIFPFFLVFPSPLKLKSQEVISAPKQKEGDINTESYTQNRSLLALNAENVEPMR